MARAETRDEKRWRRLTAELLVIALGVFLGLAADAAWEARGDALREGVYLQQLDRDLDRTETQLIEAVARQQRAVLAAQMFVRGINAETLPPPDSLGAWLSLSTIAVRFEPTMGTVEALIQTGDIGLIDDQELRTSLIAYDDEADRFLNSGGRYLDFRLRVIEELGHWISVAQLPVEGIAVSDPRIPVNWTRLADSQGFHGVASNLWGQAATRLEYLLSFQRQVETMRARLDPVLTARGLSTAAP